MPKNPKHDNVDFKVTIKPAMSEIREFFMGDNEILDNINSWELTITGGPTMPENKPTEELYQIEAKPDQLFTIYITDEIHDIISRMRARGICPSEFICGCLRLADSAWLSECEAVNRGDDNSFPF